MSAFVAIAGEPQASNCVFWTNSVMLIEICRFLKAALHDSDVLSNDLVFRQNLESSCGDVLYLKMCSETVLAEVARLLFSGADPEHEYWRKWKSYFPHSVIRTSLNKVAAQIVQSLENSKQRRDALSPVQRLCAALRFRVESGMVDFLKDNGLKLRDWSKMRAYINRGEWPPYITEFLPLPSWKKQIAQRMMQRKDK